MIKNNKIYLMGSFHGFRDKIITSLPNYSFVDPRSHRQSSVAKLVIDDLEKGARDTPIGLSVFPAGKTPGVMTYVEIGTSFSFGNYQIVVDEDKRDSVLKKISNHYFDNLDTALFHLNSRQNNFQIDEKPIKSKYSADATSVPMNKILIAGTKTNELKKVVDEARLMSPEKEFVFSSNPYYELLNIADYDLLVTNFPANMDWDRHACLLMGGAFAHDISTLIIDEHEWKYPPLQAVARRHGTINNLFEYLTEVNDLHISKEAMNMYEFFTREKNI